MSENNVALSSFTLQNDYNDHIFGEIRYRVDVVNQPAVIICHSFMAFKNWGFFPYLASKIAESGFVVITFNFSLNGVVGDGKKITDFAKFEQNTFSRELHDLKIVTDAVLRSEFGIQVLDTHRLALLGHSRGGGISIVYASTDDRVTALTTWSSISTFDRWTNHQKEKWRILGYLPLAKDVSVSPLKLGLGLLHDVEGHQKKIDIQYAAGLLRVPWLILHGKADVTVPSREAETLFEASNKSTTELMLLDHVGHLYNAASYEENQYQTLNHLISITTHWLQSRLT